MIRYALLALLLALAPAPALAGSDLNGTTGYWELASDLGFDGDANFPITVSCWVRPDTITSIDCVFCIEDKGDQNRASLDLSSGVARTQASASGGASTSSSVSKTATAGRWYHVVAILDDAATVAYVWVDGSFMGGGSGTTRSLADLDTTTLGCNWTGVPAAAAFFDGVITDVAVWSVALREDEVQRLTLDPRRVRCVRPESLVLHCPPDAMNGTVCTDVVGGRGFTKNGTITDSTEDGPPGFTPPGLGTWTPASLTGLVAWLKGDAGVTGSAPVTAWADQSGSSNDLDNTGTGAPAATSDGYGGRAGIAFTNDSLYGEPAPATAAPFYALAVMKDTTAAANDTWLWVGDKDVDNERWRASSSGSVQRWGVSTSAGATDVSVVGGTTEDGVVRSYEADEASSTSRRVSINSGQQATNSTNRSPAGADRWSIGRMDDATPDAEYDSVTVYEVVLVTSAPTDAERNLWSVYVGHRWNVTGGAWRRE